MPISNQEASTVADKLVDEVFLRFSAPEQLHSDQGRQFESQLVKEVCKLLHINKTRTTPYHPQSDGLVERFNRTLLAMLATCAKDNPLDWEKHVRKVCMAYNTSVQASTGYTPFYLMFGRQARLPADVIYGAPNTDERSVTDYAMALRRRMENAFTLARQHSLTQHLKQKELYDKKIHGRPFKEGEYVWLSSPMGRRGASKKLHHPWSGPFRVLKRISDSTYRIQQLQGRKYRKIVHFDRLKLCPNNIRLDDLGGPPSLNPPSLKSPLPPINAPPVGHNLELVEDSCDEGPTVVTAEEADPVGIPIEPASTSGRPRREHRVPSRFDDFVLLHLIMDKTPSQEKEGGDVTVMNSYS